MIYHRPTTEQLLNLYQNETVLWACAYDINDDTGYVNLKSLPVKGILVNASGQPIPKENPPEKTPGITANRHALRY